MDSLLKRKGMVSDEYGQPLIVEVFSAKEMYELIKGDKEYSVDLQTPSYFDVDVLLSEGVQDCFFFIDPSEEKVITSFMDWEDDYYTKALKGITLATNLLVESCMEFLKNSGVCRDSFIVFIKSDDKYYLEIDNKPCGFLDDTDSDKVFKQMLSAISEDVDIEPEVVVLPSIGEGFFFDNTVAVYKTIEDFKDSYLSRNGLEYKTIVSFI